MLKFLVLRGQDFFQLARDFISRNKLNPEEVCVLLSSIYVQQISSPASAAQASGEPWMDWSDGTFTEFATLCEDSGELGRHFVSRVATETEQETAPEAERVGPVDTAALTIIVEVR